MSSAGFYDRTGEYVAVLLPPVWRELGPALVRALEGLDGAMGPIVDVGAGTGLGTVTLAAAFPDAEILAVEPHSGLRTALLARVAGDDALASRVTVVGADVLSARLPDRIAALVAMNVIGHLSPDERLSLWAMLAEKLAPRGRAVLNLYPPTRPEPVPAGPVVQARVGRLRYTGTASAEPAGEDAVTWRMSYRMFEGEEKITELTASDHWYVFTPEQLADELAGCGLRVTPAEGEHGLQVITRR
ncbi:class I SAM-dependent methyltransferase [Amycolatopsis taiwanensis]|uniref:Methyltransferase domain-containing protein n=1 Tax=Amycolatopsis taiwanensis TaxID=342230 RepID=A0A9W6QZH1_9PSEU|nr:class I SAM-dependent methyltransferase [Amycolatopsis taiwanensis]GLY64795.1 hypothetical protein Atai01_14140 [Amycolatopsis taiwanensis]